MTFLIVILWIAIAIPYPTETQWFVFRVTLAASAAGLGAVIPGLIVVNVRKIIRAGGAIALLVLVYWFNPPKLVSHQPQQVPVNQSQSSTGKNAPNVISSGSGPATVTIQDQAARPTHARAKTDDKK